MPRRVTVYFLVLCLIWGSTWLFIKIGLAYWPPALFAGLRLALASALVLAYLRVRRLRLPRTFTAWWPALLYGFWEALGFGLVFWGEAFVPSGRAAVINAVQPVFVVLLSIPVLKERLTLHSVGSTLVGLLGVAISITDLQSTGFVGTQGQRYLGEAVLLLACVSYAVAGVMGKRYIHTDQDPVVTTFIQLLTGGVALLAVSSFWEPVATPVHITLTAVLSLLYLSVIGTALAFILYFYCLHHMRAAELSLLSVINPIISLTLGIVVLGEAFNWRILLGALCVLLAVLWMHLPNFRREPSRESTPGTT